MLSAKRMVALGAFALALLTTVPFAHAQRTLDAKDGAWWDQLETQVTTAINSPVEQIQVESLQHVIFFASNYNDKVDFSPAVPELLEIFETEQNDDIRTLALMALRATGDRTAMERLSTVLQNEDSARIARLTRAVLADYVG